MLPPFAVGKPIGMDSKHDWESCLEKREAEQGATMFHFIMNALSNTTLETGRNETLYRAKTRETPFRIDGSCSPATNAAPKRGYIR